MPNTKNAYTRHCIIDESLRLNRSYTCQELADICRKSDIYVTARTIEEDIRFMRKQWNAPIPRAFKKQYKYDNPQFSIRNLPLQAPQIKTLKSALQILKQFDYLPQFQDMQELILKLETKTDVSANECLITFDTLILQGLEHLRPLYDCVVAQKPVLLHYKPYEYDDRDRERFVDFTESAQGFALHVHPYHLHAYNHRWYVFGFTEKRNTTDGYALDRITQLHPLSIFSFKENKSVHFDTYFEDIIGVTHLKEYPQIETFTLRFLKPRAFYVRTKKWKNQQIELVETADNITFSWQLRYNRELEARILEYGQDVEVLEPLWLKDRVAKIWRSALSKY